MEREVPHYDDLLSSEVCQEELEHCKARRPQLNGALVRLQATLQEALCRELQITPGKRALEIAVFGLAHQAADDFYDVVLLGTHGYGIGAQKLLRPLYERVVSALYLIEHPDEVQYFNDYADIARHHERDACWRRPRLHHGAGTIRSAGEGAQGRGTSFHAARFQACAAIMGAKGLGAAGR